MDVVLEAPAEAIHADCIVCQAKTVPHRVTGSETLCVMLVMAHEGLTVEDLEYGMCFFHRRLFVDMMIGWIPEDGGA